MSSEKPGSAGTPLRGRMCYCGERPAALAIFNGQLPVCMPCYASYMQASEIQSRQTERLLNYLAGQMEMVTGLPGLVPRFPEEKPQIHLTSAPVTTHINVRDSTVGAINTGQIKRLEVAVSAVKQQKPELGEALRSFAEVAANEPGLEKGGREELLNLIEMVTTAATKLPEPAPPPIKHMVGPWLTRIGELAQGAAALCELWERVRPLLPF